MILMHYTNSSLPICGVIVDDFGNCLTLNDIQNEDTLMQAYNFAFLEKYAVDYPEQ